MWQLLSGSRARTRQRILVFASIVVLTLWVILSVSFLNSGGGSGGATATSSQDDVGAAGRKRFISPASKKTRDSASVVAVAASAAAASDATCAQRKHCLDCLFPLASRSSTPSPSQSTAGDCVWCANERRCVSAHEAESRCDDVEGEVCPAVLLTRIPQNHRVIHVGIRKGGPEALVQMHLALVHWGFNTSLDTRKSMKEKGGPVMPFFLEAYKAEFSKAPPLRWVKNYDDWHHSAEEGDVMIATETWQCKSDREQYLPRGVRQMQWHLTVWPRRDRSQCTIAGHTNYVARDYMRQSVRSLMYPYISPHIIALSKARTSWQSQKQNLVLYDSDTHLKDADLESRHGVERKRKIATGYTPQQLYELYGQAKAGIDLQLPGGERFIYEAALFDVCVIVDDVLNGADREDFPIPERFRVPPNNLDALNEAVDGCIRDYDTVIQDFLPLKQLVLKQQVTFLRQVRRYFSNSVHMATVSCSRGASQKDFTRDVVRFLLATMIQVPFAVVEFFHPSGMSVEPSVLKTLNDNSWLAAVFFTEMSAREYDEVCGAQRPPQFLDVDVASWSMLRGSMALTPNTNEKRSLLTMWLPINVILLSDDVVHNAVTQLTLMMKAANNQQQLSLLIHRVDHSEPTVSNDLSTITAAAPAGVNPAAPAHFVSAIALFTRDQERFKSSCSLPSPQSEASWMFSCRQNVVSPSLLMALDALQLDRVAESFAVVGSQDGTVLWGSKQKLDESVYPFLCTHELWKTLVAGDGTPACPAPAP